MFSHGAGVQEQRGSFWGSQLELVRGEWRGVNLRPLPRKRKKAEGVDKYVDIYMCVHVDTQYAYIRYINTCILGA